MTLLLIFESATRHRKLSPVAEELGLTKSAISHALSRLREIFDDQLFLRRQSGVQMTARALTLAPKIAAIVSMAKDALMIDQTYDPLIDRRMLRVGMNETGVALFAPLLGQIMQNEAPNTRLVISLLRREEQVAQTASQKLDLAVGVFHGGAGDLEIETLYQDQYLVVARANHPLISGRLTRAAYCSAEHIQVMGQVDPPVVLETTFTRAGVSRKIVMTLPLYTAAFAAASCSDRLVTAPGLLAQHYAKIFGLVVHPLPFPPTPIAVSLISAPNAERDPSSIWFRSKVRLVGEIVSRITD